MYEGLRGWLLVGAWWLFSALLSVFLPSTILDELPSDERRHAWVILGVGMAAGLAAAAWRVRRRLLNPETEFTESRRAQLRHNAAVGTGIGIFAAAVLRAFDSVWAVVGLGGMLLGGLPVVAVVSTYLLLRRGHTL